MTAIAGTVQAKLNKMTPIAQKAKLGDIIAELIAFHNSGVARSRMVTKAGLVIKAGASAVVKAGSAFVALVSNTYVRKPANTDMAALAGTLATAKSALWAFYISAAGTLTTSAKTADAATHDAALALLPATPDNLALIGFVIIDNATGAGFVGGTTALDTGSLTVTYYDVIGTAPVVGAGGGTLIVDMESRPSY